MITVMKPLAAAAALLLLAPVTALAHGDDPDRPDIGQAGKVDHIDRTIEVELGEENGGMYVAPSPIEVARGETVKFVVTNAGALVHEFNIATEAMHGAHRAEMRRMMEEGLMDARHLYPEKMRAAGFGHDDPNALLIEPGDTKEMIWTFSGDADLEMSCNIPGHRAAGMMADVVVEGTH